MMAETVPRAASLTERIDALAWLDHERELNEEGCTRLSALLTAAECDALIALYDHDALFRSRVVMQRHNYGRGEYRYFSYPLPDIVDELRESLYRKLSPIANQWQNLLGRELSYPEAHGDYLDRCHAAGQTRPTPLLLRYVEGDYNCLHQDLYGAEVFPLQVAILLSQPGRDFSGGEFVMTEQRPRSQSRALVLPLVQGDALAFAVNERPRQGARGVHRVKMRHGVSRLRSGRRHTLGVIFHDAT